MTEHERYEEISASMRAAARRILPPRGSGFTLMSTDLVHGAWVRELEKGLNLNLDPREIRRVLYTAMRDVFVEYRRNKDSRHGQCNRVVLQSEFEGVSHVFELVELNDLLGVMATALSGRRGQECREVVELRLFAGLDFQEIQEHLGLGEDAVRRRFMVALAWLKNRMERVEDA